MKNLVQKYIKGIFIHLLFYCIKISKLLKKYIFKLILVYNF